MALSYRKPVPALMIVLVFGFVSTTVSGPFTSETVIVNSNGIVSEYSKTGGVPLQQLFIPDPGTGSIEPRGIAVDDLGNLYAYNGTINPYLSTFTSGWTHNTYAGWSTSTNITYGGLGFYQNYVFVTDMSMPDPGIPNGLIRFDTSDYSAVRFADGKDYIDLTLGQDGLLYALYPGGSPGGTGIDVYNPPTLALVRSIAPPWGLGLRGIAVNAAGEIFAAAWSGTIYRFDANGVQQNSTTATDIMGFQEDLVDIALSQTGDIAVGTRFGKVMIVDTALNPATSSYIIVTGGATTFVTFGPAGAVPVEPTTWGKLKSLYDN